MTVFSFYSFLKVVTPKRLRNASLVLCLVSLVDNTQSFETIFSDRGWKLLRAVNHFV